MTQQRVASRSSNAVRSGVGGASVNAQSTLNSNDIHALARNSARETGEGSPSLVLSYGENGRVSAGGLGARAPARLETLVKRSLNHGNDYKTVKLPTRSFAGGADAKRSGRCELATPVRLGASAYRTAIVLELEAMGRAGLAERVNLCGRWAAVWDCLACGEQNARAIVLLSCGSRACAHCSRELARERVSRLTGALARVQSIVDARRAGVVRELEQRAAIADRAAAHWDRLADRAQTSSSLARMARAYDRARARGSLARWQRRHAAATRWGWRMVTVSPAWRPWDPSELTVEGLRRRRDRVLEQWRSIWDRLDTAGLAGAIVSVELSSGGHVHLHALVYSGWLNKRYLRSLAGGAYVDVREVRARPVDVARHGPGAAAARALKEAVKYAIKAPSPSRREWIAGQRYAVTHPRLVARWTIANHGTQLGRVYGVARDAIAAEEALEAPSSSPPPVAPLACPCCKAPLSHAPRTASVRDLARALSKWEWRHRVEWGRAVPGRAPSEVSGRVAVEVPETLARDHSPADFRGVFV